MQDTLEGNQDLKNDIANFVSKNINNKKYKYHTDIDNFIKNHKEMSQLNGHTKEVLENEIHHIINTIKNDLSQIKNKEAKKGFIVSEEVKQKISNGLKKYFAIKKIKSNNINYLEYIVNSIYSKFIK